MVSKVPERTLRSRSLAKSSLLTGMHQLLNKSQPSPTHQILPMEEAPSTLPRPINLLQERSVMPPKWTYSLIIPLSFSKRALSWMSIEVRHLKHRWNMLRTTRYSNVRTTMILCMMETTTSSTTASWTCHNLSSPRTRSHRAVIRLKACRSLTASESATFICSRRQSPSLLTRGTKAKVKLWWTTWRTMSLTWSRRILRWLWLLIINLNLT